jgi:phage tail-like protein
VDYGVLIIRQGDGPTQQHVLRQGSISLGRDPSNDIVLAADEISRVHARVICAATECRIVDWESSNGTFLNDQRLAPKIEHPLRHGDSVTIGPYTIRYVRIARHEPPDPVNGGRAARTQQLGGALFVPPIRRQLRRPQPLDGRSSYWQFLPPFYEDADRPRDSGGEGDGILNGLLQIFETTLTPIDRMIEHIPHYFDPGVAPQAMLPWLAFWVDVMLNQNWPVEQRRALISRAAELYRWRGTRKGMRDYIQIYTTIEPIIVEPGMERLDGDQGALLTDILRILKLSEGSQIAPALRRWIEKPLDPHVFRVILVPAQHQEIDELLLRQIIEAEKPAHTGYELVIHRAGRT